MVSQGGRSLPCRQAVDEISSFPRELHVVGSELRTEPIAETAVLRKKGSMMQGTKMAVGSQVEVRYSCKGNWNAAKGKIGIRTLQAGTNYTEIGYDFDKQAFYADHNESEPSDTRTVASCARV